MLSFAQDIRPLFRDSDVDEMAFAFDLHDYQQVKEHAEDIYARLEDGSMPCDAPWPADRITLVRQWIDDGCQP